MSEKKSAVSGDTDFRRKWDREEFAARAASREAREKEEAKARYEAKLAGKKYHARASTPPDVRDTQARTTRLNVGEMVGKTMLVPAGASIGKRGRGAGFYCEACDLTFKDNLQLVEHYNSKQHLQNTGESGNVAVATVAEVRARLVWLKRKREEESREEQIDLGARLERAQDRHETEREKKAAKRRRQREKKRQANESD